MFLTLKQGTTVHVPDAFRDLLIRQIICFKYMQACQIKWPVLHKLFTNKKKSKRMAGGNDVGLFIFFDILMLFFLFFVWLTFRITRNKQALFTAVWLLKCPSIPVIMVAVTFSLVGRLFLLIGKWNKCPCWRTRVF